MPLIVSDMASFFGCLIEPRTKSPLQLACHAEKLMEKVEGPGAKSRDFANLER